MPGTVGHITTELFADIAGIKITRIPYKGNGPAMTDLLGGHVTMMGRELPALSRMLRRTVDGRSGSKIGIGGSLAAPPLPHHRAYGSVHGGSRSSANTCRTGMGDRAI